MNDKELKETLTFAKKLALKAGKVLLKHWGNISHYETKSHASDLVTIADKESEALILSSIAKKYSHNILSEESGNKEVLSDYLWVVDPLDGTTNYTHCYPMVAVSIALLKDLEPLLGVIYNPLSQELFFAAKNQGAYLNGKKIQVSRVDEISKSLLVTGFAYDRNQNEDNNYREFFHLTQESQGVRRSGSAALDLAFVACARLDGFWEKGLSPWDLAAGLILIQEAGGKYSDYDGSPLDIFSGRILATNRALHEKLSQKLMGLKTQPFLS